MEKKIGHVLGLALTAIAVTGVALTAHAETPQERAARIQKEAQEKAKQKQAVNPAPVVKTQEQIKKEKEAADAAAKQKAEEEAKKAAAEKQKEADEAAKKLADDTKKEEYKKEEEKQEQKPESVALGADDLKGSSIKIKSNGDIVFVAKMPKECAEKLNFDELAEVKEAQELELADGKAPSKDDLESATAEYVLRVSFEGDLKKCKKENKNSKVEKEISTGFSVGKQELAIVSLPEDAEGDDLDESRKQYSSAFLSVKSGVEKFENTTCTDCVKSDESSEDQLRKMSTAMADLEKALKKAGIESKVSVDVETIQKLIDAAVERSEGAGSYEEILASAAELRKLADKIAKMKGLSKEEKQKLLAQIVGTSNLTGLELDFAKQSAGKTVGALVALTARVAGLGISSEEEARDRLDALSQLLRISANTKQFGGKMQSSFASLSAQLANPGSDARVAFLLSKFPTASEVTQKRGILGRQYQFEIANFQRAGCPVFHDVQNKNQVGADLQMTVNTTAIDQMAKSPDPRMQQGAQFCKNLFQFRIESLYGMAGTIDRAQKGILPGATTTVASQSNFTAIPVANFAPTQNTLLQQAIASYNSQAQAVQNQNGAVQVQNVNVPASNGVSSAYTPVTGALVPAATAVPGFSV